MAEEQVSIILGDEYDDELRDALRAVLIENGAVDIDRAWGVGGSQEIEILQVMLGTNQITVEAETFIGLTVSGPKLVIDRVNSQVRDKLGKT